MIEQSYVMVKPEFSKHGAVIREVMRRLTAAGFEIVDSAVVVYGKDEARQHYSALVEKPFYPELEEYITSDCVYGMVVEGENAVDEIRELVGATKNPAPGTIRHDIPKGMGLELRVMQNVVHASDSVESAKKEIKIYQDLVDQKKYELERF